MSIVAAVNRMLLGVHLSLSASLSLPLSLSLYIYILLARIATQGTYSNWSHSFGVADKIGFRSELYISAYIYIYI